MSLKIETKDGKYLEQKTPLYDDAPRADITNQSQGLFPLCQGKVPNPSHHTTAGHPMPTI